MSKPNRCGDVGESVVLDYYDGPLLEVAKVSFGDPDDEEGREPLAQFTTNMFWVNEMTVDGPQVMNLPKWAECNVRLSRSDLVAALAILDGHPVKGFFDSD